MQKKLIVQRITILLQYISAFYNEVQDYYNTINLWQKHPFSMQRHTISLQYISTFCNEAQDCHNTIILWQKVFFRCNDLQFCCNIHHPSQRNSRLWQYNKFVANLSTNCNHLVFRCKRHQTFATKFKFIATKKVCGNILN